MSVGAASLPLLLLLLGQVLQLFLSPLVHFGSWRGRTTLWPLLGLLPLMMKLLLCHFCKPFHVELFLLLFFGLLLFLSFNFSAQDGFRLSCHGDWRFFACRFSCEISRPFCCASERKKYCSVLRMVFGLNRFASENIAIINCNTYIL